MNNNMSRRPVGPIHQYSLQQSPRHRHSIHRQRSTEVENSQQIYLNNSVEFCSRFRGKSRKYDDHHHISMSDRPNVRMAWNEQSAKLKTNAGVEIIARQIKTGKPSRSTFGRDNKSKMRRCPRMEKATVLYSRQELAERLRLAWKEREENKANIDIFLAHSTVGDRCDSRMSTETNLTVNSTPKKNGKKLMLDETPTHTEKTFKKNAYDVKNERLENKKLEKVNRHEFQQWSNLSKRTTIEIADNQPAKDNITKSTENKASNEIAKQRVNKPVVEKKSIVNTDFFNPNNTSVIINDKNEPMSEKNNKAPSMSLIRESDYSQAKIKRTNYQSGLNKAFINPIVEKPSTPRICSRSNCYKERVCRTSSAPPQHRTRINIIIDTRSISRSPTNFESDRLAISSDNQSQSVIVKSSITANRSTKSATVAKRRSKGNKKCNLSVTYFKDGGDKALENGKSERSTHLKPGKNIFESKTADVVTMVSLISSADSESEMDETSSRDDKLIFELRSKLPTIINTPIIKSSNGLSPDIKKQTIKSVSFQQDSHDREDSALQTEDMRFEPRTSLRTKFFTPTKKRVSSISTTSSTAINRPSRDASLLPVPAFRITGTSEILPVYSEVKLTSIETVLTDREKRCLAVPIGDVHDKKRKLFRCRSATVAPKTNDAEKRFLVPNQAHLQAEVQMSQMTSQTSLAQQEDNSLKVIINSSIATVETDLDQNKNLPKESYCQTPKEKECWHLYRRMCDKGVFVSFDTVLRGMLTPTEYRLRQKELSQNC